jgi:drug/metabolite transporter (DMT)-like permease
MNEHEQLVFLGVVNNLIPVACVSYGEQFILVGVASAIVASTPIFVIIISHFFLVCVDLIWMN